MTGPVRLSVLHLPVATYFGKHLLYLINTRYNTCFADANAANLALVAIAKAAAVTVL